MFVGDDAKYEVSLDGNAKCEIFVVDFLHKVM